MNERVNRGTWDRGDERISYSVGTHAFVNWFDRSRVVDAAGAPLVVYHGTADDVPAFDADTIGRVTGSHTQEGFYFTSRPDMAEDFATMSVNGGKGAEGPNIVPAYRSLQNPLEIDATEGMLPTRLSRLVDQAHETGHDGLIIRDMHDSPVPLSATVDGKVLAIDNRSTAFDELMAYFNGDGTSADVLESVETILDEIRDELADVDSMQNPDEIRELRDEQAEYTRLAEALRDDPERIKINDAFRSDVYVAFEPGQIKSIYNTGSWDRSDDRILYSVSRHPDFVPTTLDARERAQAAAYLAGAAHRAMRATYGSDPSAARLTEAGVNAIMHAIHRGKHSVIAEEPAAELVLNTTREMLVDQHEFLVGARAEIISAKGAGEARAEYDAISRLTKPLTAALGLIERLEGRREGHEDIKQPSISQRARDVVARTWGDISTPAAAAAFSTGEESMTGQKHDKQRLSDDLREYQPLLAEALERTLPNGVSAHLSMADEVTLDDDVVFKFDAGDGAEPYETKTRLQIGDGYLCINRDIEEGGQFTGITHLGDFDAATNANWHAAAASKLAAEIQIELVQTGLMSELQEDNFKREFPDFEMDVDIPNGFDDHSWHHDVSPSFVSEDLQMKLWVDYANPNEREFTEHERFSIYDYDTETHDMKDVASLLTEEWSDVPAFLEETIDKRIAAAERTDDMIKPYQAWCDLQGLPKISADELLHECSRKDQPNEQQMKWLSGFIERWENQQTREDQRAATEVQASSSHAQKRRRDSGHEM